MLVLTRVDHSVSMGFEFGLTLAVSNVIKRMSSITTDFTVCAEISSFLITSYAWSIAICNAVLLLIRGSLALRHSEC